MRPFRILKMFALLSALGLLGLHGSPGVAQAQDGSAGPRVTVVRGVEFHGDLRDLPIAPQDDNTPALPSPVSHNDFKPPVPGSAHAAPAQENAGQMPLPTLDMDGIKSGSPTDANGDVGPQHYMEAVNSRFEIWNKDGTNPIGPTKFTDFFSKGPTNTLCDTGLAFDPVVLFDTVANRWLVTTLAVQALQKDKTPIGPFFECIAISKTSDPTLANGWFFYAFFISVTDIPDYPKFGAWRDGYYYSTNTNGHEGADGTAASRVTLYALDRTPMLSGKPTTLIEHELPHQYTFALPANIHGALPAVGEPEFFVAASLQGGSYLYLWKFFANFASPNLSFVTGPFAILVPPYSAVGAVLQPNPTVFLDTLDASLRMQLQYRRIDNVESLWTTHAVDDGTGAAAMRWYQIVGQNGNSPVMFQTGIVAPHDGVSRWMGSLAVDRFGNMAVGYNVSSLSLSPGIRYGGRLASDPLNSTPQGEGIIVNGNGTEVNCKAPCIARWGDYSAMTVDPVDDCTFWYTNQYTLSSVNLTRFASFAYPGCAADLSVTKSGTPYPVVAGQDLTYTLLVKNNGTIPAQNLTLNDNLPDNTTFQMLDAPQEWACTEPNINDTGSIACTAPRLNGGKSATFTLKVHVNSNTVKFETHGDTVITNTAHVDSAYTSDPSKINNFGTNTTIVTAKANLVVDLSHLVSDSGHRVNWDFKIGNKGPSDSLKLEVTDDLDTAKLKYTGYYSDPPGFLCVEHQKVVCTLDSLAAHTKVHLHILTRRVSKAPTLCNSANVTAFTFDPNIADNHAQECFNTP